MIHAGAVRDGVDIDTYWTRFISYRVPGAHDPANLLASMDRSPLRYLTTDDATSRCLRQVVARCWLAATAAVAVAGCGGSDRGTTSPR